MAKVLMFHRVLPAKLIKKPNAYSTFGTLISQEYFEKVLTMLVNNGFHFATVSELSKQVDASDLVALSFDDGYSDCIDFVLPSLQKFKATATFYPVANPCKNNTVLPLDIYYQCVDELDLSEVQRTAYITGEIKKTFYWCDPTEQENFLRDHFKNLPVQNRVKYLHPQQIKFLSDNGFEIGSHSMTHSLFTAEYMNENRISFELKHSKYFLESITGKPINSFCFPSGYYNSVAITKAKEAGYTSVCIIKKNENLNVFSVPIFERLFVRPNSINELQICLNKK